MNKPDRNTSFFWVVFGPASLVAALLLLFYKTAPLLGRPVWLFGLAISILIACVVSYLAFKEVMASYQKISSKNEEKEREIQMLRATLDEAHFLYREKVDHLEDTITSIEKQHAQSLSGKEAEIKELKIGYEVLFEESQANHSRAASFQTALEDAMDELREVRQSYFLHQEMEQEIPKDLLHQYKQLREQFEEKSLVLEQTRRRLFITEGFLVALKKQQALEKLDQNAEEEVLSKQLKALQQENDLLEEEVAHLEGLISQSFKPSKSKKSKKEIEELLQFQFDSS